jgi:predicted small secreted protein
MKSLLLGLVASAIFTLTGCNTVKGVGQDLQKAGSAIEGAAKKN